MFKGINWIAVLVAVVLQQALGYLWYGPLFGAQWTALLGHEPDMSNVAVNMSLGVVVSVIIAVGLAWLIGRLGAATLIGGLTTAFAAWFFFNFTTMAVDYLYVGQNAAFVGINMGYQLVAYLLSGAVIGMMKPRGAAAATATA
ncbi:MAG: DUF1761 domain-containing protein [Phenylobacterium sp.]|uniref:DUF1761 domain-containing protein n=1 Tax=Phenylobacterium sp. TaxID=1871053 RepID=UPI003919A3D8